MRDHRQQRREQHQHQRDAVHTDLVLDAEEADPGGFLHELEAGCLVVEGQRQQDREDEGERGGEQRPPAHGGDLALVLDLDPEELEHREGEEQDERADERREDDEAEDVEPSEVDHQRAIRMKKAAMTMSPTAMPSA